MTWPTRLTRLSLSCSGTLCRGRSRPSTTSWRGRRGICTCRCTRAGRPGTITPSTRRRRGGRTSRPGTEVLTHRDMGLQKSSFLCVCVYSCGEKIGKKSFGLFKMRKFFCLCFNLFSLARICVPFNGSWLLRTQNRFKCHFMCRFVHTWAFCFFVTHIHDGKE